MLSSSAMFPLSSKSFSTGSEPRTYLICRPLNSLGLSLLTKAWTWGNLPNFHPQTSRIAPAYSFLVSNCASSWQHPLQSGSSWSRLNCPRRSQELQSKLLEKPNSLHASEESSAPKADTAWSAVASSKRSPRAGRSHPPGWAAIPAVPINLQVFEDPCAGDVRCTAWCDTRRRRPPLQVYYPSETSIS